jgi:DNA topoisomerase-3
MHGIQTEPKPYCPECGAQMVLRRPRPNQDWEPFWGCSEYPDCKGTIRIDSEGKPEDASRWWVD